MNAVAETRGEKTVNLQIKKKKFQQPIKDAHLQIAFYEFYMDQ